MKTIRGLIENNNVRIVAGGIIIFCGILDLSFGAAYSNAGSIFSLSPMTSLYSSDQGVKSVSGFTILSGLLMILATVFIFWDLSKNQANKTLSFISWSCSIMIVLLNFTCGILTAQVYTPAASYFKLANMSISSVGGSLANSLNFSVAVCVFSFVTGYPASLYLLAVANGHRQKVDKHVAEDESLNQSQVGNQHHENQVNLPPQMEQSQVQQVGQVQNYHYPQYTQQHQEEREYRSSPFQVDMTYNAPKSPQPKTQARQNVEMQSMGNPVQNTNNPVVRQIEIERSSYEQT